MLKVLFIITSLERNGAQLMLWRLLSERRKYFENDELMIVSISSKTDIKADLSSVGVSVYSMFELLTQPKKLKIFLHFYMARELSSIQSWMYHANLISFFLKMIRPSVPVVWHIRHGLKDLQKYKFFTRKVIQINAILSRFVPNQTIYNSCASRQKHYDIGFSIKNTGYIPNGYDTDKLTYSPDSPKNMYTFGIVGRLHPDKGQIRFLDEICKRLHLIKKTKLVFIGDHIQTLRNIYENKIGDHLVVEFREASRNVKQMFSEFDCLVLPSETEAFPNVVAEAILHSKGVIAFNVGDVTKIYRHPNHIIDSFDYHALIQAMNNFDNSKCVAYSDFNRAKRLYDIRIIAKDHFKLW